MEDVCLKDAYTVKLKNIPDINVIITELCDLLSHEIPLNCPNCPSAILFQLFVLVFKLNFWRGAQGRDSLKKQKILH